MPASGPAPQFGSGAFSMPVTKRRLPSGKVRVSTPGGVRAKATTPAKAKRLERLLNAIEHNPDFRKRGSVHGKGRKAR